MSTIIQPKKEFVNTGVNPGLASQQDEKLQEELTTKLLEIYKDLNIIFMGTPEFAVPILNALCQSDFKPRAVITAPDKPIGRKQEITASPIKIIAQEYKIPVFQPETKQQLIEHTHQLKPDLIVVAAYGKILPKEILDFPKYGTINVHPSLLPKYRGPSPIPFAILNGDEETGVTIMLMNEKMDEGPILAQQILTIDKKDTAQSLSVKLSQISAGLLVKMLNHWIILKEMPKPASRFVYPQEQDSSKATYTKILTKEDGKIIWNKSAVEIERQIRAFFPWPGSFAYFKQEPQKAILLKIISAESRELNTDRQLGEVFLTEDKKLAVQTGQDTLIINQLQIEGSKPINSQEFLNGHSNFFGTILE